MAVQTYTTLTAEQSTFYDKTLLSRLIPNLLFYKYGQKKPIPKKNGGTINWRRFNSLPAATTALTEGQKPGGATLSISTVTATVAQYGDYTLISDVLDLLGIDPVITETTALHGEQAGLTIDTIIRDVVRQGTNVLRPNSRATIDAVIASDKLTSTEIKLAVKKLRRANVKPVEDGMYIGIIDPETALDLQGDSEWQDVSKYNGGRAIMKGEIGCLHGVRFVETSNVYAANNAAQTPVKVHHTVIFGKDAYGISDLEGSAGKPKVIVKAAGSAGTEDPLDQVSSVGWKALFTTARLDENAIVRIEHAATE